MQAAVSGKYFLEKGLTNLKLLCKYYKQPRQRSLRKLHIMGRSKSTLVGLSFVNTEIRNLL